MTEEYTSFDQPKATEGELLLPRGYVVKKGGETYIFNQARLREITGVEEDIMNGDGNFTSRMMRIVGNCLTSLRCEQGDEIADEKTLMHAAKQISIGDLTACMFAIYCVTHGTEFRQKVQCPNPQCGTVDGRPFTWTARFDLKRDFPPKPCDGDPGQVIRTYKTSRGTEITWKFMTGEDRLRYESNNHTNQKATAALMTRVVTVNGEPATAENLRAMAMREREEIRKHIVPQEGGIDVTFDAVCSNCGHEFQDLLAINGFDFFYPSEISES
jgi:hypothetical protein